jgi:imidazolonepropionase-like amidohydrolase
MGEKRYIVAGSLIDGSGSAVRRNVFLAVKDGIILDIGAAADLSRRDGVAIDDFPHCTIVPALVDCSVSLLHSPAIDRRMRSAAAEAGLAEKTATLEKHMRYCHDHGVLGVAENDSTGLVQGYLAGKAQRSIIDIRTSGLLCRNRQESAADNPAGGDFLRIRYSPDVEDVETSFSRLSRRTGIRYG